jgi:hypothetical protein
VLFNSFQLVVRCAVSLPWWRILIPVSATLEHQQEASRAPALGRSAINTRDSFADKHGPILEGSIGSLARCIRAALPRSPGIWVVGVRCCIAALSHSFRSLSAGARAPGATCSALGAAGGRLVKLNDPLALCLHPQNDAVCQDP